MTKDVNNHPIITMGQELTCAVTGKKFIAESNGWTFNYAWDQQGRTVSDEGVDISERKQLLDRTKPFFCYVASKGKPLKVTGWKGNVLGDISDYGESPAGWQGASIARFRVKDVHGQWWSGRGAGRGMCCTLRPMKTPK